MGSSRAHNLVRLRARDQGVSGLSHVAVTKSTSQRSLNTSEREWTQGTFWCDQEVGVKSEGI
jgi:hypothetical protein